MYKMIIYMKLWTLCRQFVGGSFAAANSASSSIGFSTVSKLLSSWQYVYEGTLKWNSQDITKANTIQASKKFRNRCPRQKLWLSDEGIDAATVVVEEALLDSLDCSVNSTSFGPRMFRAMEWQISHVLIIRFKKIRNNK